jgi:Domain of unknown function (DUF6473)
VLDKRGDRMADAFRGAGALDYFPCRYGASRQTFRVPDPYPVLLEEWLGLPVVNLGCPNAGLDVFAEDPALIAVANRASAVVVQVLGAQNLSNRFYSVHPRRNDRFLGATPALRALYRDVDFTEFAFTRHLLMALQRIGPDRFATIAAELRQVWMRKMHGILAEIRVPVVLLWVGDQAPPMAAAADDLWRGPLLVDAEMMAGITAQAAGRVDVVVSAAARAMGVSGMAFAPVDAPVAKGLPGPTAHREVARALRPALEHVLSFQIS